MGWRVRAVDRGDDRGGGGRLGALRKRARALPLRGVDAAAKHVRSLRIRCMRLEVDGAFHSPAMKTVVPRFRDSSSGSVSRLPTAR
jgi:acyl transferase domain-containing protein